MKASKTLVTRDHRSDGGTLTDSRIVDERFPFEIEKRELWVGESGASVDMTPFADGMFGYQKCISSIATPSGDEFTIEEYGNIRLRHLPDNNTHRTVILSNA